MIEFKSFDLFHPIPSYYELMIPLKRDEKNEKSIEHPSPAG